MTPTLRNDVARIRATGRAFGAGAANALAVAGERCPDCPYSIRIHVAADGAWLGCPPDERTAVDRWGRQ